MRLVLILAACCAVVVPMGRPAGAEEPGPDTLNAQDVLDRMAKTYTGCKSYRDTGVVKTVFIRATGGHTEEKLFKTAFVRPDRFRFEYTEDHGGREARYIVWRSGEEVLTWWDFRPGVEKPQSLDLALARATGVSSGSAHTVPALLLPTEIEGRRLTDLTEAKRAEDGRFAEAECFRIEGKFGDSPTTLWIDKKTVVVRRVDLKTKLDDFSTEETTTYDPVLDEKVPDKALDFDPPKRD